MDEEQPTPEDDPLFAARQEHAEWLWDALIQQLEDLANGSADPTDGMDDGEPRPDA